MNRLPPPAGFETWLDYAVETMDTRTPYLERLLDQAEGAGSQEAMKQAVRDELANLRAMAAQGDSRR